MVEAIAVTDSRSRAAVAKPSPLPAAPLPIEYQRPINPRLRLQEKPRHRRVLNGKSKARIVVYGIALICVALCLPALFDVMTDDGQGDIVSFPSSVCLMIAGFIAGFSMHFAPTIYAVSVTHKHALQIWLLNVFLGWTIVGWVVALVWASMHENSKSSSS